MLQRSHRRALLLKVHSMGKGCSFGGASAPLFARHSSLLRRSGASENGVPCIRALHRSESKVSVEHSSSLRASTSEQVCQQKHPQAATKQTSIIQALRDVQWNNVVGGCRQQLTVNGVVQFARKLPFNVAAGYVMVRNSREYELAQRTVVTVWMLSVRVARTSYLWLGLFLESREYFYLRYYSLLGFEHAIAWLRYGLSLSFTMIRSALTKK